MITQDRIYDADSHVPELYDALKHNPNDLRVIRELLAGNAALNILEPFCGTGRLAVPLAMDGHILTGLDSSEHMLQAARAKCEALAGCLRVIPLFIRMNVLDELWPNDNDLIILGGNCLYELPTPSDQAGCLRAAWGALRPGGKLFLDNDHMEGSLAESWKDPTPSRCFPSGRCKDGTVLESTMETIWYSEPTRLVKLMRRTRATFPDGTSTEVQCVQQKHPPSIAEMEGWLREAGFEVVAAYGDYQKGPLTRDSQRATFWAEKLQGGHHQGTK